jgi:hypothetical protein
MSDKYIMKQKHKKIINKKKALRKYELRKKKE